jgi:hypothetical protein
MTDPDLPEIEAHSGVSRVEKAASTRLEKGAYS